MAGDTAASAAAKGATYLMALQISSRALTFVLNQVLLRFLTAETLGRAVQLELYSMTVLFFARESIRVALQRVGASEAGASPSTKPKGTADGSSTKTLSSAGNAVQTVVNLSYLTLAIGVPLALGLGVLCVQALRATSGSTRTTIFGYLGAEDPIISAVLVYGLATVIELASEPGFAAAQSLLLFKVRAGAEAVATVGKTVVTVGTALAAHRFGLDMDVLPFAYGQLAFASLLCVYYTFKLTPLGKQHGFVLGLRKIADQSYWQGYFSRPLLTIATSLSVQSGVKYVLTQGDTILIAALASLQDQGTYALAANYGGLIARMLFQPIEEASRNIFAKLCAEPSSPAERASVKASRTRAGQILVTVLHVYGLLGLMAYWLGPTVAPLLLTVVAGQRWADSGAAAVLAKYTYYIPLLAINGVLEAFVASVATNRQLYRQSVWMGGFFIVFASSAWWFVAHMGLGAEGIVWANCINMVARIAYCNWFAERYFKDKEVQVDWNDAMPNPRSVVWAASTPMLLKYTPVVLSAYGTIGELVRVGGIAAILALGLAVFELAFFRRCYGMVKGSST